MALNTSKVKDWTKDDIIQWCDDNDQLEWLLDALSQTTTATYHTGRIKVYDEAKGKEVWKADKNSPTYEKQIPITFVQVKSAFIDKFFPTLKAEKQGGNSMRDEVERRIKAKRGN